MAGQEGNDVTFKGGLENYSAAIRHAGEELLTCLVNPKFELIFVIGYNGVGRWRIIEYAARKLKGSYLLDAQILVKLPGRDFSVQRAQMGIAYQLGLSSEVSPDDEDHLDETKFTVAAGKICESLMRRRFLLIVGDVSSNINVQLMGVPLRRVPPYDSKVVLVGDYAPQLKVSQCKVTIDLEEFSIDMLRDEVTDVVHSPDVEGCFTPEAVLNCCLYLWFLFNSEFDVKWMIRNWIAEGFIIRRGTEEDDDLTLEEKAQSLLRELEFRSLARLTSSKNSWKAPLWLIDNAHVLERDLSHGSYWIRKYPPRENSEWEDIQRMNLWGIDLNMRFPHASPKCPKLSTLLLGRTNYIYSSVEFVIPDIFFEQMQGLRVLHLNNLQIKSLPPSIACLHNLRLLRICGCKNLKSLPSSFEALYKLEFLEVSESSSLESIPDDCFRQMTNLRFLFLHRTNIRLFPSSVSKLSSLHHLMLMMFGSLMEIPDDSFECMQWLRVLDLSGDSNLKSLPSSLSKLLNLKRLKLSNCSSLKMKLLPHLEKLSTLEELDLCKCNSLEDIDDVPSSLGNILPKLQMLDLSGIEAIQQVSLNGYQSLESVSLNWLTNLRVLSLSGTKIKSFPENMWGTGHLKRLNMLRMNYIREIKWDALSAELEYLNINQCDTLNSSANDNEWLGNVGGSYIRVSNHYLLKSFTPSSKSWGAKCFSRFHICISPSQEDERRRRFVYASIGSKIQTCNLPPASHFNKHLEIQGGDTSPNGIHGVLSRTELFTLSNNAFVRRLSDLGDVDKMTEMKECQVEGCEQIEIFFEGENASSNALCCLEKIWMSNLTRLRSVCEGTYGNRSFTLLKHIQLEFCQRLAVVFSSGVCLQSLETLQIKFCNRLEAVFRGEAAAQGTLQRLHTLCLWELPKLESICSSVSLPALKKLRVSGCGKLTKLPLRVTSDSVDASSTAITGGDVEVEGELVWWASLKFEEDRIKRHVNFKERRPFTRCR